MLAFILDVSCSTFLSAVSPALRILLVKRLSTHKLLASWLAIFLMVMQFMESFHLAFKRDYFDVFIEASHLVCKFYLLECCLTRSKDPACKEVVLLINCSGPVRPVRQVRFWPYHFFVALRLVGMGYTVGGGSGPQMVALN